MTNKCTCGRSPTGNCVGWHKLSEEDYKKKKVLVLGFNRYVDVAESYGFERFVTPSQLVRADPDRFAFTSYGIGSCHERNVSDSQVAVAGEPFDAIIQLTDCVDWLMESQVCLDILRGDSTTQQQQQQQQQTIKQCVPYVVTQTFHHFFMFQLLEKSNTLRNPKQVLQFK